MKSALFIAGVCFLTACTSAQAQTEVWSGADATNNISANWSDPNNWSGGTPGSTASVYFFDTGANGHQGIVNNIVDENTTISLLEYGNTNEFDTTQIASGVNLTVSNNGAANLVFVGTSTDNGSGQTSYSTITGQGMFFVISTNAGSYFIVQQGSASSGSHMATLDLSGLGSFNLTAGRLVIGGAHPGSGGSNWLAGTFYLAATNNIRVSGSAPALDVGDAVSNGATSYLYLGQTNAIFADSMTIAHSKATCTMSFARAFAGGGPMLFLAGNTNSRMSALAIGDFSAQSTSASTCSGTVNLMGGGVNAKIDVCYVGRGQAGAGPGTTTGLMGLGAGTFNVNTLNIGYVSANTAVGNVTGTVDLTNGTLLINGNLVLGYNAGSSANASGALNVTNGTVLANNVVAGGGTSRIALNGGLLSVTNALGSPGAPLTSLTLDNGATLQLRVSNYLTNAAAGNLYSDNSGSISIASLPPLSEYPSQFPLIFCPGGQASGINFTLSALPGGFSGYISNDNSTTIWLVITNGPPLPIIQASVSFSATNSGTALNPAFCGLSYEKSMLTKSLFSSNDAALIQMFSQIAPAVLRVGGNSVDTTCWGGLSNKTPITADQVAAFAGFVKALPTNWRVIYGINMSVNNPGNCAAEAAYAASLLGPSLLGFEIGNETDLYHGNGIRSNSYTYAEFLSEWQALAAAITNAVPGWAITNAGNGWTFTGPASAYNTEGYTVPFAANEAGVNSLVTQHYYRGNGQDPSSTLNLLLQPDPTLHVTVSNIVAAATAAGLPLGFRMAECGSFYNGGAPNVSDAYGTALWTLDFMLTIALNGGKGVNFHGGGNGTGYTPIADNGTTVVQARPEFYGLKMFSLLPAGRVIPAVVTLGSNINFTAYGARQAGGRITALLDNKDTNDYAQVTVELGPTVSAAQMIALTGPALNSTNGYALGGAPINADGSWIGSFQPPLQATNGQLTIIVPPISAVLIEPILPTAATNLACSLEGNQLNLSWPSNYIGWLLQSNSVSLVITNDWFTVPGSNGTNACQTTITPTQANVFYRLAHP